MGMARLKAYVVERPDGAAVLIHAVSSAAAAEEEGWHLAGCASKLLRVWRKSSVSGEWRVYAYYPPYAQARACFESTPSDLVVRCSNREVLLSADD